MSKKSHHYRPDIDGLRAIAVLGVVLFHAGLAVPGGFTGVDIFFVISGYLITGMILRALESGSFSFLDFWDRRIRRILPALAAVLVSTLVFGWFFALPFQYLVTGQMSFATLALSSNIHLWRSTGYFVPDAKINPLLHTWSLSVEEQFYLVVPILLVIVFRWGRYLACLWAIGAITVGSFICSLFWVRIDPPGAFYLLPFRAWELGVGCLIAMVPKVGNQVLGRVCSWVGALLILIGFIGYRPELHFPGAFALLPVLGAGLVIWAGQSCRDLAFNCVLSAKPLVWIGLLSYSWYLWHWPVFAYHRYFFGSAPETIIAICYLIFTLVISMASLRYIERPFRDRKKEHRHSHVFCSALVVVLVIMGASLAIYRSEGLEKRLPDDVAALAFDEPLPRNSNPIEFEGGIDLWKVGESGKAQLLLWGDSHALALFPAIEELAKERNLSVVAAIRKGKAPLVRWDSEPRCDPNFGAAVLREAKRRMTDGLTDVLLVFRWSIYTGQITDDAPGVPEGFETALIHTLKVLEEAGLRVTVLTEVPAMPVNVVRAVCLNKWRGVPLPKLSQEQDRAHRNKHRAIIERIESETRRVRVVPIEMAFYGGDGMVEYLDEDKGYLYSDSNHLSKVGAMRLLPLLEEALMIKKEVK